MIFFTDIQFWLYTKLINLYIRKKDFDRVGIYLEKKKGVAKIIREKLKQK
jgi:hypothetical protein